MRYLRNPLLPIALLSALLLLFQWRTALVQPGAATDFDIYYHAAGSFDKATPLYSTSTTSFDQYLYPPPCILIFRFFHHFRERTAWLVFDILMYGCLMTALWIALAMVKTTPANRVYLLFFALASAPVYHQMLLGQINALVLLLSISYLYWYKRRPVLAGACLACAIWIKVYPVLLLAPALFYAPGRKAFAWTILAGILVPLLCLPILSFHQYLDFARTLAALSQYTAANIINQSFTGFSMRIMLPWQNGFSWPSVYWIPRAIKIFNYALLLLVLIKSIIKVKQSFFLSGIIILAACAVFSPLGWGHTFVFCLPLWLAAFAQWNDPDLNIPLTRILTIVLAPLLLIPVYNHPGLLDRWPHIIGALYFSRFLFITLFLIFLIGNPFAKSNLTSD